MSRSLGLDTARFVERSCWGVAVIGVALAVRLWRDAQPRALPQAPPISSANVTRPAVPVAKLIESVNAVVARDPFRLARRPSPIPFKPDGDGAIQTQLQIQRPVLALAGIIGGPPWTAALEGIPGRDGPVVVRRGDTLAGLRVREVGRNHLLVAGMDTVWRLTLKRIWR